MTKEELEKEANDYAEENQIYVGEYCSYNHLVKAYLAGAEPREKRIAELEQENAELKADNDARKFAMAMSEKVEKQLREENAELRNKLEHRNCLDCSNHSSKLRMKTLELEKECTNAKEIIKDLLSLCEGETDSKLVFTRAEQFLNSEVEK